MKMQVEFDDLREIEAFVRAWAPVFQLSGSTTAPDQAMQAVSNALPATATAPLAPAQPPAQPPVQAAPIQPPVQTAPAQTPPPAQAAPVQPPVQPPAQPVVPTTAVTYKLDDLARAAMTLMDTGRQAELQQMLARFGVQSLPELPPEQYGAFATELRAMGAQI